MNINKNDTAVVFTDPQIEVLSEKGGAWGLVRDSVRENGTTENMERIFKAPKQNGHPVFISPHAPGNQIRSVGVKQSAEISPKRAEARIAAVGSKARQFQREQPEQSVAARYKGLLRVSAVIGAQRDAEVLFPLLASELRQVVRFDFIGISQYDEATNKTQW